MKKHVKFILLLAAMCHGAFAASFHTGQSASSKIGGLGTTATSLSSPSGVAMDPATGKLFVSDRLNHRVMRYSSTAAYQNGAAAEAVFGQTSTSAATSPGGATSQTILAPRGLAVDDSGNLWVVDSSYNRVLRFPNAATVTNTGGVAPTADLVLGQSAFNTTTSTNTLAGLNAPYAVAISPTYVWVADTNNNRVLGYTIANLANGLSASKNYTATTGISMSAPCGVALSGDSSLWVADTGNNRLLRYNTSTNTATAVIGQADYNGSSNGCSATQFYSPEGLAADRSGTTVSLWVADRVNNRVVRFDDVNAVTPSKTLKVVLGQSSSSASNNGSSLAGMDDPEAVAVDTYDPMAKKTSPRAIWVADKYNNRVLRFSPITPAKPTPAAPVLGGATRYKTKKAVVTIRGTATPGSGVGIASVQYKGARGGYRLASGGTAWSFKARCKPGRNRFTVVATDTIGHTSAGMTISVNFVK
jgi:sugar lactone lactonase YvrE